MAPEATASRLKGAHQVEGSLLFRFAVVTDTHVNHDENATTSPWPVNRLANGRVRHAFRTINAFDPEFVVHVGDMVHPTPTQALYGSAVERFRELSKELRCPIHLTPGNHDIGDKAIGWSPARPITPETLAIYERVFGESYYAFAHRGCYFIILNSLLIESGLEAEAEQWDWLETELCKIGDQRIFVFIHDPLFTTDAKEAASYDNIPEKGRDRLAALLPRHKIEAVISGHVHNFWYNCIGATELYILPSTTFVRQDYAEFYKIEAGPEGGRDDVAKLGVAVVDVYERGHVLHVVRTGGVSAGSGTSISSKSSIRTLVHTKSGPFLPVGVDLRHPWAEVVEISPSGGVDEFGRKRARNDYPLQALWEMGIAKLRVPIQDLLDDAVRARMRIMASMGHEFTIYTYGIPRRTHLEALIEHAEIVSVWELILPEPEIKINLGVLADFKAARPLRIHLSMLRPSGAGGSLSRHFAHAINHGYTLEDAGNIKSMLRDARLRRVIDGLSYRVACDQAPLNELPAISELAAQIGINASIHVRLAAESPAEAMFDDVANANRVAETLFASLLVRSGTDVILDTFDDVDRGFFHRNGLCDRRFNPRLAGRVFSNLQAMLRCALGKAKRIASNRSLVEWLPGVETDVAAYFLATAPRSLDGALLKAAHEKFGAHAEIEMFDLAKCDLLPSSRGLHVISAPTLIRIARNGGTHPQAGF